jgi:monoamine oxidase
VSGISCGNELKSNFNILILEARNRTLGRVYTEKKLFKTPMGKFKKLKKSRFGSTLDSRKKSTFEVNKREEKRILSTI